MARAETIDLELRRRRILDETPWLEEKFTTIKDRLIITGRKQQDFSRVIGLRTLSMLSDTDMCDPRLAVTLTTDERLALYRRQQEGGLVLSVGSTIARTSAELVGVSVDRLLWSRQGDGFSVEQVAYYLAEGTADLQLTLSQSHITDLQS